MLRNQWTACSGIRGRYAPDFARKEVLELFDGREDFIAWHKEYSTEKALADGDFAELVAW